MAAGVATRNLLSRMLFQLNPTDSGDYVAVALSLGPMALGACYFSARRASRIDHLVAPCHK